MIHESAMETSVPASAELFPAPVPEVTPQPETQDFYQYIGDELLPEMKKLLFQNPDTVGWICIPGVVDLPVMYRDNSFYLDHDFREKKSSGGTLFLDEAHPFAADTQYLVIHGHNMFDGSMFGLLSHYRNRSYMQKHPTVFFSTLFRQEEYEIVGVLRLSVDVQSADYLAYTGTSKFDSPTRFDVFARDIREKALYWKDGAELRIDDALLALSTCYGDDRIVVMCRRVGPLQP